MSDRLITVTIVLFVLSMVCERVANFLKLGLSDILLFKNLRRSEPNLECEKQRELGILRLNIACGFAVAVCFGADFNFILGHAGDATVAADTANQTHNSIALLGNYLWQPVKSSDLVENTLLSRWMGTLLVAFFISFGSKFWHDLVDLLLETKNLRGKLADQATYQVDNVKQLDEFLQLNEGDMVETVFRQRGDELRQLLGVRSVGLSNMEQNGRQVPCITIVFNPGADTSVVGPLYYDLGGGRKKLIAVSKLVRGTAAIAQASPLSPGNRIGNRDTIALGADYREAFGSLGFWVYRQTDTGRQKPLLLTCYHVLRYGQDPGMHQWAHFLLGVPPHTDVRLYDADHPVAQLVEGLRTAELDVALAMPLPGMTFDEKFGNRNWQVKGSRWPNSGDPNMTRVRMLGGVSGEQWGVVRERDMDVPINYHDGERLFKLTGLITVSSDQGQPISRAGDSGSLLTDENGYALGLVVAADTTHTYAIPVQRIFNSLHLMF